MTDFKLHDGVYLDKGQQYEIPLLQGPTRLTITNLDSRRENITFILWERGDGVFRNMSWQEFSLAYQRGFMLPYNPIQILKRLPPHTFL